jgi:hypothetical protein
MATMVAHYAVGKGDVTVELRRPSASTRAIATCRLGS